MVLSLTGACAGGATGSAGPPGPFFVGAPTEVASRLAAFREVIRADLEARGGPQETLLRRSLAEAGEVPIDFKPRLIVQLLRDPWEGLIGLEMAGRHLAARPHDRVEHVARLLDLLSTGSSRAERMGEPVPAFPTGPGLDEHLAFVEAVLARAARLRDEALAALSSEERAFLFAEAEPLAREFSPQLDASDPEQAARAALDWRWARLYAERVQASALLGAAKVLACLGDEEWLRRLAEAARAQPDRQPAEGDLTGDLLAVRHTPFGTIVVGGPGPNTYRLADAGVAVLIDIGGRDTYYGSIAAPDSAAHGVSLAIDLAGDDQYHADPLGLATGRLGVGMLIEREGDDVYHLAVGAGGTAFGGVGVLLDAAGHDRYVGTRLTQGAAIGGIGLLLDLGGDDEFTSFGYAIGFGGPVGTGALVDAAGDDRYTCGGVYPSTYNALEVPDARPGAPDYQYEGFCLGVGVGRRLVGATQPSAHRLGSGQLGGGMGWLVDAAGGDRYESGNFSQGTGYFFGAGIKLDLAGDDRHGGARYGHGAAAHRGVGLFLDERGADVYTSSGPAFNAGTAWDRSVAAFVDAGSEDDVYELGRSDGLGRAAHGSWSLAIEEAGNDRYVVRRGLGLADAESAGRFFDLSGTDEYVGAGTHELGARGNGRTLRSGGGLFVDR